MQHLRSYQSGSWRLYSYLYQLSASNISFDSIDPIYNGNFSVFCPKISPKSKPLNSVFDLVHVEEDISLSIINTIKFTTNPF